VYDLLKFTKLINEFSTNTSPRWKDDYMVTVYYLLQRQSGNGSVKNFGICAFGINTHSIGSP